MTAVVAGTFATGATGSLGQTTQTLIVPTSTTTMRLTLTGLDGSNTVKTQRSQGGAFADQATYSSDQTNVAVTVAAGEKWRVVQVSQQPIRDIRYKMSCES